MKISIIAAILLISASTLAAHASAPNDIEVSPNFDDSDTLSNSEPDTTTQEAAPIAQPDAEAPVIEESSRHAINAIAYTSGGIGIDDKQRLDAEAVNYNLKLVLTLKTGHFLSDVVVQITDSKGELLLDTLSEGPLFYAKLDPGTYTVTATVRDKPLSKKITITQTKGSKKLTNHEIYFRWEGNEPAYWESEHPETKAPAKK